ncbi:MAG: hypothetical protein J6Y30_05730 [Treponema sp.]|nr:hypothetical protein [Treponema sp.]
MKCKSKDKKLSGGFEIFMAEDESLIALLSRNTVYVYDLATKERVLAAKTVSNASCAVVSPDKKIIAAKNTSGTLALVSMESGLELCRCPMEKCEGEMPFFTLDSRHVIDLDWGGRVMVFDTESKKHSILDNTRPLIRCDYIHYDFFSKRIYRFMAKNYGNSPGIVQSMLIDEKHLDPEHAEFKTLRKFNLCLPDHMKGISFCKIHNYWLDLGRGKIIRSDKDFKVKARLGIPKSNSISEPKKMWVSPDEKYLFIDYGKQCTDVRQTPMSVYKNLPNLSCLFDLKSGALVKEFEYNYVSDFTMYGEDSSYIIATWSGTYIGSVES